MRGRLRLLALTAATAVLAACGGPGPPQVTEGHHVDNCGRTQVFAEPPQRVVSLNQHATEILVALGLGDRLVGTAYPDDAQPPESVAAEYDRVPLLAEKYPSVETILEAEPDLVVGGYSSAFRESDGRGRESLEDMGLKTLLLSESCVEGPAPPGMELLTSDITMFGEVLGLQQAARELNADIENRVRAVEERLRGKEPVDVFVYDSGENAPMTYGGRGVGADVLERAGARNVFADVDETFPDVSWEEAAARQPEAVILLDYLGAPLGTKRDFLRGHPLMSGTPAVREDRFITMQLVELTEGIRFPDAVEDLAEALHGV